jgi:amino acid efflux transporter
MNGVRSSPVSTTCMVAVYAFGMVAAVRILDRFSVGWWLAVISVVLVAGLVALAGQHLIIPAALALAAIAVTAGRSFRPTRMPAETR